MRWNFGDSRRTFLSLDEFLAQFHAQSTRIGFSPGVWKLE
jgi:hypothetical protein